MFSRRLPLFLPLIALVPACIVAPTEDGELGSAAIIATGGNEFACSLARADFRTPDEAYDPPLGCQ